VKQTRSYPARGTQDVNPSYNVQVGDNEIGPSCGFPPDGSKMTLQGGTPGTYTPVMIISASDTIGLNTWYCLTVTYGNDTLRAYKNGVLTSVYRVPGSNTWRMRSSLPASM